MNMATNDLMYYTAELSLLLQLKQTGAISEKEFQVIKKQLMKWHNIQSDLLATA